MTAPEDKLALARQQAADTRRRFAVTMVAVQNQLRPERLIDDALGGLSQRVGRSAGEAVQFIRARPASAAAVGGALLLFLFRRPIADAIDRALGTATGDAAPAFNDTETGGSR